MSPKNWRSGFGPDEKMQRVRPVYSGQFLNNPHKGATTSQLFNGDPVHRYRSGMYAKPIFPQPDSPEFPTHLYPDTRVAYFRWPWGLLEPEKGRFRWEIIDNALATAEARNQALQMRSMPWNRIEDLPTWYWSTGAKHDRKEFRGSGLKIPDCNDRNYIRHWSEHILATGARYDGHPNLDSVDIGYAGVFGEMGGNATYESAARLVDAYVKAFPTTQLISMLGTPGCAYAATLTDRRIGWRADCFGDMRADGRGRVPDPLCWDHMHDEYPRVVAQNGVADTWKTAPAHWEPCWHPPHWYEQGWDLDWIIEQGYKYHPSLFMAKSHYWPAPWFDRLLGFCKHIGYRFGLHQMLLPLAARPGQKMAIETVIDNKGVAPIYKPYALALRFSQGRDHHLVRFKQDIRQWMPDLTWFSESLTLPRRLQRGTASVACAIVDTMNRPVVKLAIREIDQDDWHPLTHIDVR